MLDLGAWAAVQAEVEERHRQLVMRNDVLARSVEDAFFNCLDRQKLQNIYDRWLRVLDLIQKSAGGNELVESCRGKSKLEDVPVLNISNIPVDSDSEDGSHDDFSIDNATEEDTDTDNSADEGDDEWETVSIEHDSDSSQGSTIYDVDIHSDDDGSIEISHNSEETRMDNEVIYNSMDDETVYIEEGHDNEISDFDEDDE